MEITYYGDGNGNWLKRVWAEQCLEKVFIRDRCQGMKGHAGNHWCYRPDGSCAWSSAERNLAPGDAAGGFSPPGSKGWINPVDTVPLQFRSHYEDSEVTDPELIARLNRGELEEDESLDQPATEAEIAYLKEIGRI